MSNRFLGGLYLLAFAGLIAAGVSGVAGPVWGLYAAAFVPYFLILRSSWEGSGPSISQVLGLALLVRVALLMLEPTLSDDLYRYVWEGRVVLAGFNPFVYAPDAPALEFLRDSTIWPAINHRSIPTIYPPVAQYLFAANALLGGGTVVQRLIFLVVEASVFLGVLRMTSPGRAQSLGVAIYALNPLVIVETAWSGHLDVVAWAPAVLAIFVWSKRTSWRGVLVAGGLLGLSIGAKFLGVFVLFALVIDRPYWGPEAWVKWRDKAGLVAFSLMIVGASYIPFVGQGGVFSGFGSYAASWRANDGIFRAEVAYATFLAQRWTPSTGRLEPEDPMSMPLFRFSRWDEKFVELGWTKTWNQKTYPNTTFAADQVTETLAKMIAVFLVFLAALWCLIVGGAPAQKFLVMMGTLLFVAPTVHPWYVAWLVPFAAITQEKWPIIFSAICLVAYASWYSAIQGGPWSMPWWLVLAEYSVVAVVALGSVGGRGSQM